MRFIVCISLFFLVCFSTNTPIFASDDSFCEPWGEESFIETRVNSDTAGQRGGEGSILRFAFINGIKFFQNVISPVDGDRCPMYPICSEYGILALRKHGPFLGFVMIADRLIHERDEMRYAPEIMVGNRWRYYDPLENNDFWWADSNFSESPVARHR